MKGSTIAFITLGVCEIGLMVLCVAANRHAVKRAKIDAVAARPNDVAEAIKKAQERCGIFKQCKKKEDKILEDKLMDWQIANSFGARKIEIIDSVKKGVNNFKEEIGYFEKMDSFDDEFKASLEGFKKSISYDDTKASLEKTIKEAKTHYESQKRLFDLAGNDISEEAMKLRHAAEESMNAKVKEASEKLKTLEQQITDEVDRLTKSKGEKVRVLEEKVAKEKLRLDKCSDGELEKLNKEFSNAKDDILKTIRKERSLEEQEAISMHEADVKRIRLQKEADAELANDILETRPGYERIGAYLKSKKVPKFVVGVVAALPMIPLGYLIGKYVQYVVLVIRGM